MEYISNEEYHSDTSRISKSGLDKISKSPAHYFAKYLDPNREPEKETDALRIGKAVHSAILEPDDFADTYGTIDDRAIIQRIASAKPKATKAYKEFIEEKTELLNGRIIIPYEDYQYCKNIRDKVHANRTAAAMLSSGRAEETIFWEEPETGAPCKIRMDWLNIQRNVIVDIKTTEDASPRGFARSVEKYRYHVQDAFYSDGLYYGEGIEIDAFIFIAVEKTNPFNIGIYTLPAAGTERGRELYIEGCRKYMECRESGIWAGYSDQIEELQLSKWALSQEI